MPHLCYHNIRSRNKKTTLREQLELYSFSTKNTKGDKFITPYIIKRQAHYLKLIQNLIKLLHLSEAHMYDMFLCEGISSY